MLLYRSDQVGHSFPGVEGDAVFGVPIWQGHRTSLEHLRDLLHRLLPDHANFDPFQLAVNLAYAEEILLSVALHHLHGRNGDNLGGPDIGLEAPVTACEGK